MLHEKSWVLILQKVLCTTHHCLQRYMHWRGRWKWRTWKCRTCFRCLYRPTWNRLWFSSAPPSHPGIPPQSLHLPGAPATRYVSACPPISCPSFSCPSISCLDTWSVNFMSVNFSQPALDCSSLQNATEWIQLPSDKAGLLLQIFVKTATFLLESIQIRSYLRKRITFGNYWSSAWVFGDVNLGEVRQIKPT